jgi:hypothetical protein
MQPAAAKINYDGFNKTNFGQCPLLAQSDRPSMSAFGGKADMAMNASNVCF